MSRRLHTSEPLSSAGPSIEIDGPEAHHLLHVLRGRVGDEVEVFDGVGWRAAATVVSAKRQSVRLDLASPVLDPRVSQWSVVIACPLPKGDARQKWLIEKLTELGVTTFVPLRTDRESFSAERGSATRLLRGSIEACKQCRRNQILNIAEPTDWTELVHGADRSARRLIGHPSQVRRSDGSDINLLDVRGVQRMPIPTAGVIWAFGPEGGLTDEEVATAADATWQPVTFGPRILRMETACEVAAVLTLGMQPPPHSDSPTDSPAPIR